MPIPTDYEIRCRGCSAGDFVPLQRKNNRAARFYYNHPRGCHHQEDFDPDIQDVDTLKREVSGVEVRRKAAGQAPKAKPPKESTTTESGDIRGPAS